MQNFGRIAPREGRYMFSFLARMSEAKSGAGWAAFTDVASLIRATVLQLNLKPYSNH
jgi:hypothetical protein